MGSQKIVLHELVLGSVYIIPEGLHNDFDRYKYLFKMGFTSNMLPITSSLLNNTE